MVEPKLARESFIFDNHETIVKLHEEVMIENEKYHDSIPNFIFILALFQLSNQCKKKKETSFFL